MTKSGGRPRPSQTPSGQARQRSAAYQRQVQQQRRRASARVIRRRRIGAVLALTVIVVGIVAAAAGLAASSSSTATSQTGGSTTGQGSTSTTHATLPPVVVSALHRATFVDNCSSCSTENFVTGTSTNGRTIGADIWYPSYGGNTPATGGNAPLIVLAPGYDLSPNAYLPLIFPWVHAGYVVAAIVFPDTNPTAVAAVEKVYPVPDSAHNPESDVANQPRDIAFVLSQLVADDRGAAQGGGLSFLHSLFDPAEIGIAGQSDGGDTVAGLYFNSCCQADTSIPVGAVAVLSGAEGGWFTGTWFGSDHTPLLVSQGTNDACNSPDLSDKLYDSAPAGVPKYFLVLEGADHLVSYTANGPYLNAVAGVTTAFFNLYLHHHGSTRAELLATGTTAHTTITGAAKAPELSAVRATWLYDPGTSRDPCSINFAGVPGATSTSTAGSTG